MKAPWSGVGRVRLAWLAAACALAVGLAIALVAQFGASERVSRQTETAALSARAVAGAVTGAEALTLAHRLRIAAFADLPKETRVRGRPASAKAGAAVRAAIAEAPRIDRRAMLTAAHLSFEDAVATLLQDPDARVRTATLQLADPSARAAGVDALLAVAREGGAAASAIWRAAGALLLAAGDERALAALENARALNPQDKGLWRQLGYGYGERGRAREAAGAAYVDAAIDAAARTDWRAATQRLERALALLEDAPSRAFLFGRLGDVAAALEDWEGAEAHYREAVDLDRRLRNIAGLSLDASKLARAQARQGDDAGACSTLRRARVQGAAVTDAEFAAVCR